MQRPRYTASIRGNVAIPRQITARIVSGTCSSTRNGYADASIVLDFPRLADQMQFYAHAVGQPAELVIAANSREIYHGRIEAPTISSRNRLELTAVGFQNAYRDIAGYTALWSNTQYDQLVMATEEQLITAAAVTPNKYTFDNTSRLYLTPVKDSTFIANDLGYVSFLPPDETSREDMYVSFSYSVKLPSASWVAFAGIANEDFTGYANKWALAGSGAVQTGTHSFNNAGTGKVRLLFGIQAPAGAYTSETDSHYIKLTSLRIKSTSSAAVYADEIVKDLVSFVSGINSSQVSSSTAMIESPGVDLTDELYEDMTPADILDKLGKLGDDSTIPQYYDWGVWQNKVLQFAPRGTYNHTWLLRADDLELTRNDADTVNSTYAVYQDATGRTQRTTPETDDTVSYVRGIVRRQPVSVQTTSSLQAAVTAEALRMDRTRPQARAALQTRMVYSPYGTPIAPCFIRGGDRVKIRNIPSILASLDGVQSFNVLRTDHDLETGITTITPDAPAPILEMLLARREERIR